jgi:hypothetical protein
MSDPFAGEEWEAFADRALGELVPKLRDSSCTVSLVPTGSTDVKFAVELGFSIMLDKPIIAVVAPGTQVPGKLVAVADEIVEGVPGQPGFEERFHAALARVLKEHG